MGHHVHFRPRIRSTDNRSARSKFGWPHSIVLHSENYSVVVQSVKAGLLRSLSATKPRTAVWKLNYLANPTGKRWRPLQGRSRRSTRAGSTWPDSWRPRCRVRAIKTRQCANMLEAACENHTTLLTGFCSASLVKLSYLALS